ncbi:hypothetical protein GCM10007103_34780 [Salinimicrobium marinum]|uniref:Uncharacterized protein n=1 Tax=Salinimicrobium marinum TaxID=680283 RepID=A0A918SLJ7_9FLAO|nr:hypothetical protein GCM10007103_34780 [Salinimicrobium marinum]
MLLPYICIKYILQEHSRRLKLEKAKKSHTIENIFSTTPLINLKDIKGLKVAVNKNPKKP